jgi:hypothetical protein
MPRSARKETGAAPARRRGTLKAQRLGESPVTLRLPVDLVARIDALLPKIVADSDMAALLGGVSRSSALRLVIVEGLRVLEGRYGGDVLRGTV